MRFVRWLARWLHDDEGDATPWAMWDLTGQYGARKVVRYMQRAHRWGGEGVGYVERGAWRRWWAKVR